MARTARWLGWSFLISGAVVLLYAVYLLWFTGLETERFQSELAADFPGLAEASDDPEPSGAPRLAGDIGDERLPRAAPDDTADAASSPTGDEAAQDDADDVDAVDDVDAAGAIAALWFERDGERIVHDEVLYVLDDVSRAALQAGPGHYPESDRPGSAGNFAVAGHRTTYGSPFWSLNELAEDDTIHVVDRVGREWVYAYVEQQVVSPEAVWVLDSDPRGVGEPTITLTTCHPRGSAAQRLIVFGELIGDPRAEETA